MEKNHDELIGRSLRLAARIVDLCRSLTADAQVRAISEQLLTSGTAVGSEVNTAAYCISPECSLSALQNALKYTADTEYRLRLLILSGYIKKPHGESLLVDCLEIKKMLCPLLETAQKEIHDRNYDIRPL